MQKQVSCLLSLARLCLEQINSPYLGKTYLLLGDLGRLQGDISQALKDYLKADVPDENETKLSNIGECYMDLYDESKNLDFKENAKKYFEESFNECEKKVLMKSRSLKILDESIGIYISD